MSAEQQDADRIAEMQFHFGPEGSGCYVSPEHAHALLRENARLQEALRVATNDLSLVDIWMSGQSATAWGACSVSANHSSFVDAIKEASNG